MQCRGVRVEILALHLAAPVLGGYQLCHSAAQAGLGSSTRHVGSVYRNIAPSASQPLRLAATSSATLQHRKTGLVPGVDRRVKKWGFVLPPCMQCRGVRVEILALHLAAPVLGGYQLCHSAAQAGLGSSTRHVGSVYRNIAPSASQPLRLAATNSATLQHPPDRSASSAEQSRVKHHRRVMPPSLQCIGAQALLLFLRLAATSSATLQSTRAG